MSEIRVTSVVGENGGDRVGLTTGLTVGPLTGTTGIGATITHQGHAQFAGVCTATSFSGNGANLTGLSSGLSMADQWRKKATQNITGNRVLITGWERPDRSGTGGGVYIGGGMSISGNYFSFPATGIYLITFDWSINCSNNNVRYAQSEIEVTKDNGSNWYQAARAFIHINRPTNVSTGHTASCNFIIDVDNTTNDKVKFTSSIDNVGDHQVLGDEDVNVTTVTFLRLGDT